MKIIQKYDVDKKKLIARKKDRERQKERTDGEKRKVKKYTSSHS